MTAVNGDSLDLENGMNKEQLGKVFEANKQVTTQLQNFGTGLDFLITKVLVEMMGG